MLHALRYGRSATTTTTTAAVHAMALMLLVRRMLFVLLLDLVEAVLLWVLSALFTPLSFSPGPAFADCRHSRPCLAGLVHPPVRPVHVRGSFGVLLDLAGAEFGRGVSVSPILAPVARGTASVSLRGRASTGVPARRERVGKYTTESC